MLASTSDNVSTLSAFTSPYVVHGPIRNSRMRTHMPTRADSNCRLPLILVSRFLLDLQEAHRRKVIGLGSNDPTSISDIPGGGSQSMVFRAALGSLGGTIDHASWDTPDDDADGDTELPAIAGSASSAQDESVGLPQVDDDGITTVPILV